jgi:hypothetical protein
MEGGPVKESESCRDNKDGLFATSPHTDSNSQSTQGVLWHHQYRLPLSHQLFLPHVGEHSL